MNRLIIRKIYIFGLKEKKAYCQSFFEGINIITSERKDGNNVGKSVIMKSIYHALGADCFFSDRFDVNNKTFLIKVSKNNEDYYFLRFRSLFKIFDSKQQKIYETTTRGELSKKLKELFGFYVELPNKITGELELTPPAFMYLLNFLDQDKMVGSKFASFRNLEQYSNFKENVLYNYFGIFNKEYYDLEKSIMDLTKQIEREKKETELIESMLEKIAEEIGNGNYSSSDISLEAEIESTKDEYVEIVTKLNESKTKIIKLKNDKAELELLIESINKNVKYHDGIMKKFSNHTCPICESKVDDIDFRYKHYDRNEDYLFLHQSVEVDLEKIVEQLESERAYYNKISKKLSDYNSKIRQINKNVDNVIKHKGYIEMRDKLIVDLNKKKQDILNIEIRLNEEKKKYKKYQDLKKQVNEEYFNLMSECTEKFGLQEIDKDKLKNIKHSISGSGSNIPICTMIWYLTLLKIKEKFNPEAILFPLVLDSPNNGELSDESKKNLFSYIFENYNNQTQLIISTLGFEKEDYEDNISFNIVELKNSAYHLLSEADYDKYIEEYKKIMDL